MAKRPNLTKADRDQVIALYQSGDSGSVVARKCGVNETTVWRWAKRAGVIRGSKEARRMVTAKRPAHWLTTQQLAEVVERFKAGQNMLSIAQTMGLYQGTVWNFLNRNGLRWKPKLSESQIKEIVVRYVAGESAPKLAKEYGVSSFIYRVLKDAGVQMRSGKEAAQDRKGKSSPRRCFTLDQELEACRMYESGMTQQSVAKHFSVSTSVVFKARKKHGIPTRAHVPSPGMGTYTDNRARRFRSSWERAFAAYLDSKLIEWQYEPAVFPLSNGKLYMPDFYVPDWGAYVEVKGFIWKDGKQKIDDFREEYPDKRLLMVSEKMLPLYGIKVNANRSAEYVTPATS